MSGQRTRGKGELAQEVLGILRASRVAVGAGDIQAAFEAPAPAYTTLLTVLDRLVEKGEVLRHEESPRKVRFSPARSAAENASDTMLRALEQIDDRRAALLMFAGDLDDADLALLRTAVARKRSRG